MVLGPSSNIPKTFTYDLVYGISIPSLVIADHEAVEPGKMEPKTKVKKVSCNNQHYVECQIIYTLRFKKNFISKMYNHKDNPYVTKILFHGVT